MNYSASDWGRQEVKNPSVLNFYSLKHKDEAVCVAVSPLALLT